MHTNGHRYLYYQPFEIVVRGEDFLESAHNSLPHRPATVPSKKGNAIALRGFSLNTENTEVTQSSSVCICGSKS